MARLVLSAMAFVLVFSTCALAQETAFEKAVEAYFRDDYVAAVELLKQHVAEKPEARAYYVMGYAVYALERKGNMRFGDSARHFRQAYFIDPLFDPSSIGFEFNVGN
jgi:hypothetical protein